MIQVGDEIEILMDGLSAANVKAGDVLKVVSFDSNFKIFYVEQCWAFGVDQEDIGWKKVKNTDDRN